MPRTYDRKTPTTSWPYSEAVADCKELMVTGSLMRATDNISEKTLRRHLKNEEGGAMVKVQGQPTSLPLQCEKELSLMLTIKANGNLHMDLIYGGTSKMKFLISRR